MIKICPSCNTEFETNKNNKIYCTRACKNRFIQKKWKNKFSNTYYSKRENFFKHLITLSNYNRSELTVDFLEELWEKQKGLCALSGVPMTHIRGEGRIPTNISIDRIDSNIGYIKSNVQLVCVYTNKMKMDETHESLLWWCEQIMNNFYTNQSSEAR